MLIFRRGPTEWFHLLRWRLDQGIVEPGAWVKKKLFPRDCDFSSDGELLLYCLKGGFKGEHKAFAGIARAPWLDPLAWWDGEQSCGMACCFATEGLIHTQGEPFVVNSKIGPITLQENEPISFRNERRRGWTEAPDCPPRDPADVWGIHRNVILQKRSTSHGCVLRLISGAYQPGGGTQGEAPRYEIDFPPGERIPLSDAAWAEWDHSGRLLVATKDGHLTIREPSAGLPMIEDHDLTGLKPTPMPAPEWASSAPPGRGA